MIELYKRESSNVFSNVKNEEINAFVEMVFEAYEGENTIFACGNGGNVAAVENLVVDLNMHPFVSDNFEYENLVDSCLEILWYSRLRQFVSFLLCP